MAVNNRGVFLQTTQVYDPEQIYKLDANSDDFRLFLVYLYENANNNALQTNVKDTGYYHLQEYLNGQLWFYEPSLSSASTNPPNYRPVFRKVVNFGTLPNAATTSQPHGIEDIDTNTTFTRIYATASDTGAQTYIPIPFASPTLNENISITVDNTNVNITTGINRTNFTTCYVVLEYIRE